MAPAAPHRAPETSALADELAGPLGRYRRRSSSYRLPPRTDVIICGDADEAEEALRSFLAAPPGVIGLDTEWTDGVCSVALLQLAAAEVGCLILQMRKLARIPSGLQELLLDPRRLKCGVAIAHDLKLLEAQYGLRSSGFVDLQPLAVRHGRDDHGIGLASICRSVLGTVLAKEDRVRRSDWAGPLNEEQVTYAACDAYVAVDIFSEMFRLHAGPGEDYLAWCSEFVDRIPKGLHKRTTGAASSGTRKVPNKPCAPQRKTALYGGCRLISPSGIHLANVSIAKASWYVSQNLGVREDDAGDTDNPAMVVRLTFEPKGVGHAGDEFYLQKMENRCVGCGQSEDLVRFSIVPHAFRCLMPSRFKEHSSHDIVLLCHQHFGAAVDASQARRRELLSEYWENGADSGPYVVDPEKVFVRGAALALRAPRLPDDVRATKEAVVRRFLGKADGEPLADEEIEAVRNMKTRLPVEGYESPEVRFTRAAGLAEGCEEGGTDAQEQRCFNFVVSWRQCFLDCVQPRFLPNGWDLRRSIRKHDDLFGPGLPEGHLAASATNGVT